MTDMPEPWPDTAEALMRSRFAAFCDGDADWLAASWHHSTRPDSVDLTDNPQWRSLQIVSTLRGGPDDVDGVVEFRASFRSNSGHGVLHERSRFVREDGRWYYLDGEVRD